MRHRRHSRSAVQTLFVYEHLSGGAADCAVTGGVLSAADAAGLRAAGTAMRDAVVDDLLAGGNLAVSIGAASEPAAPRRDPRTAAVCSVKRIAPHPGQAAADFVARQSAVHDLTWVIAPETGGLLGRLCSVVEPARWLGCQAEAIALAASKKATVQRLAEHAVCTPLAFAAACQAPRWVVKPDDGAGALATRVRGSRSAALADASARGTGAAAGGGVVVEPWVDGEALSLSLLCRAGGAELLSVNRQSIAVDTAGNLRFDGVEVDVLGTADRRRATLHAVARQIAQVIHGLRGFVGVDLVWHAQRGPVIIEINPRVTSAYVGLPAALGRRLAPLVVAAHGVEYAGPASSGG